MQRPRNRQGRAPQQNERGRGRGRGESRSGPSSILNVPSITQLHPGAPVSIVLKIDQPTGREVQGTVADVLTNGNHPRGIKVRLADGRVGRVQRMVNEETARAGADGLSGLGRNGEVMGGVPENMGSLRFTHRHRDVREEEEMHLHKESWSLADLLPAGHPLLEEQMPTPATTIDTVNAVIAETRVCPVCGEFEGDEAAVSHHVAGHFD